MEAITRRGKYDCLLFDLDDTLYPLSSGLNLACRKNIEEYMLHHLQIEESQVKKMCLDLYKEYGTTMAGLKALGYEFDDDDFHAYAHGRLPYEELKPDPVLRNLLLSMPQRKIIFTNSDRAHVAQVLARLGLEDCFEGIICFEMLNPSLSNDKEMDVSNQPITTKNDSFTAESESSDDTMECAETNHLWPKPKIICKPSMEAMEAAFRIAKIDPNRTIFFDDSVRNIATGKAAGLHTVIVGRSVLVPGADLALNSIHNIKEALPEIWEGKDQVESVVPSSAVETPVIA